jgi:excinuclease ABC subunit A
MWMENPLIKLAYFLTKGTNEKPTLFIFDEPTTGLHFHDIHKLLISFESLINNGHSVLVIEHNPEVIKSADWVIDLGKEGGDTGGNVVFAGTPEQLAKFEESYTGLFLKEKLT